MRIKEVVEGFASVKFAKDKTRKKLIQQEQMLDQLFTGQLPDYVELPAWIIQKLNHLKSGYSK